MQIKTFEDLNCLPRETQQSRRPMVCFTGAWKACRTLRIFVARQIIPCLPKYELYRLGDQILRSARSSTANLAEGYGRFHYMDNAKYCSNSRGSCWENWTCPVKQTEGLRRSRVLLDHLITANDEDFITDDLLNQGRELVYTAVKLINGYMNYLQKAGKSKTSGVSEPNSPYGNDAEDRYPLPEDSYPISVNSYREDPDNR